MVIKQFRNFTANIVFKRALESRLHLASKPKPQNKQMHGRISPRRACNPCGYTMKMISWYHRLLIYDVK